MEAGEYEPSDMLAALNDPRVVRVFSLALRDHGIRRRFSQLRRHQTVASAVLQIADEYLLSEEHVRSIIYRKSKG